MNREFREKSKWILPVEGTLGNKAQNLLNNTPLIQANGFDVPRSLVVPFEYLANEANQLDFSFVLENIDRYFPGWTRILVRSNSPDEDLGARSPGLHHSDDLWHRDRDYAWHALEKVTSSYSNPAAALRRKRLGLPELGMCLLIMEPITNTPGEFDASYAGCFSDIGELAVLTFTNPKSGLEGMLTKPIKRLRLDNQGYPIGEVPAGRFNMAEYDLGKRLRVLADSLPQVPGKGWEFEFVCSKDGDYIVQTTPIKKQNRIEIPSKVNNIFNAKSVIGTGEFSIDGILYVPFPFSSHEGLVQFDTTHSNYAIFTDPENLALCDGQNMLRFLLNPSVIISLNYHYPHDRPFPQHVQQYMREGRIAMDGNFPNPNFSNINLRSGVWIDGTFMNRHIFELAYSPTKLYVAGDEFSQKGIASVTGRIHKFQPLTGF